MLSPSLFRNRNFTIYLAGNTVSMHGQWMHRVALGWLTWELTASELWLGVIAVTEFLPTLVLAPLFGVLADRLNRRLMALLSASLSIVLSMLLALFTASQAIDVSLLWVLVLGIGIVNGAFQPVRMSIIPSLVVREHLPRAVAFQSIAFNLSRFVGPALAGIVIALWGLEIAFAMNALSYTALIVALIVVDFRTERSGAARAHFLADLADGVRYAATHATIRPQLMVVGLNSGLGRGIVPAMLPAFAGAVFAADSAALATLTSASGAGAIVGGLWLSHEPNTARLRGVTHCSLVVTGTLLCLLGATQSYAVGIALVGSLGLTISLSGIGSTAMIQSAVAEQMRGRVLSLWGAVALGASALGSLVIGALAERLGLSVTIMGCGALCAAGALALAWRALIRRPEAPLPVPSGGASGTRHNTLVER